MWRVTVTNHVRDEFPETLNAQHRVITSNEFYLAVVTRKVNGVRKVLVRSVGFTKPRDSPVNINWLTISPPSQLPLRWSLWQPS